MTVTLELKSEVEVQAIKQSASRGLLFEDFLETMI